MGVGEEYDVLRGFERIVVGGDDGLQVGERRSSGRLL